MSENRDCSPTDNTRTVPSCRQSTNQTPALSRKILFPMRRRLPNRPNPEQISVVRSPILFLTRVLSLALLLTSTLAPAQSPDLLLQHVTVISMTGASPRKNLDVLIHAGRIQKIATHIAAPAMCESFRRVGNSLFPASGTCTCTFGMPTSPSHSSSRTASLAFE